MADVPSYKELLNPTLAALHQAGRSATIREIAEIVARNLRLSDETLDRLHGEGPQNEFEYRLAWARTYLKKQGLITNPVRGVWALTSQGATTIGIDPETVMRGYRDAVSTGGVNAGAGDTANAVDSDGEELKPTWEEQLISAVHALEPSAFERLCQRMLREAGFIEVTVTGRSGDGGIDGHGIIRMGGLISFPTLFQCKRYNGSVTAGAVRDFRGAMQGRSDKGLLITTGTFTRDAMKEATRDGAPPIDLIDGSLLVDKLKELRLGVKVETVEQVVVDTDFFAGV